MANPRKPAALRALEGNRGHRPIPNEVKAFGKPKIPERLNEGQREVWNELIDSIPPTILKSADVQVLERMSVAWHSYRGICEQIARLPGPLIAGSTGSPILNPLFRARAIEAAIMDKCGMQLGLSPVARTKLVEPDKDDEDPLAKLLDIAANG